MKRALFSALVITLLGAINVEAGLFSDLGEEVKRFSDKGYIEKEGWSGEIKKPINKIERPIKNAREENTDNDPMQNSNHQDSYPAIQPATFCQTVYGSCHLHSNLPKGSFCYCMTPYGPVNGISQ